MIQRLLVIDDETDAHYSFRRIFESPELEVSTASSGEEGLKVFGKVHPDLVLCDIRMGGITGLETLRRLRQLDGRVPVILMTAYGSMGMAIEAMKLGAYDYLLKPFDVPKLQALVEQALRASKDMREVVVLAPKSAPEDDTIGIVGSGEAMQRVFKLIGQLATSDATALITGESGTGKELVARAVYQYSARSQKPFLAVNCAAIPENLLESELFGHEKGAFTGATQQRIGRFEQCNGGTLFLDEIGEMPLLLQAKLLRVLQNGVFERLGGNAPIQVSVRIVAATNRSLEDAVAKKEFREDLFYRLNVFRIHLPPLRDRKEDLPQLIEYFLRQHGTVAGPTSVSATALRLLESYGWPGNVRELENCIKRAVVLVKGRAIGVEDLPDEIRRTNNVATGTLPGVLPPRLEDAGGTTHASTDDSYQAPTVAEPVLLARKLFRWARAQSEVKLLATVERELVSEALRETDGNQVRAAKLLGITRATLRKRVDKFGIKQAMRVE